MKNRITNITTSLPAALFVVVFVFALFAQAAPLVQAETPQQKWDRLKEKQDRLEDQIDNAEEQADHLHAHADSLREAIGELDGQITDTQKKIDLRNAKIEFLDLKLKRSQKELARQKELLGASMRALYMRGDASAVELLVASEDFSEFMDEQEYLDRLKDAIHESANKIVKLQKEIKEQRNEQKALRDQQVAARQALDNTRRKRAALLAETEGREASYRALAKKRQAELKKAEEAMARIDFSSGSRVSGLAPIGQVGCSGSACLGTHLHFEARTALNASCSSRANPEIYFNNGTWKRPVPGNIGLGFGQSGSYDGYYCGYHAGVDFPASLGSPYGTPVRPVAPGVIRKGCSWDLLRNSDGSPGTYQYGYMAIIKHDNGLYSMYAHMITPSGMNCG